MDVPTIPDTSNMTDEQLVMSWRLYGPGRILSAKSARRMETIKRIVLAEHEIASASLGYLLNLPSKDITSLARRMERRGVISLTRKHGAIVLTTPSDS